MDFLAPFGIRLGLEVPITGVQWLAAALHGAPGLQDPGFDDGTLTAIAGHGLLPRLYVCLRNSGSWSGLSPQFQAALSTAFQQNAARTFLIEDELRRVLCALGPGVRVALLKGMATGRVVYGSPAERPVSDVDLLVLSSQLEEAGRAFASLGYIPSSVRQQGRRARWLRRFKAEAPFVGAGMGTGPLLIELHWSLVELPFYIRHIPPAELWSHVRPQPGLSAGLPDPALLLLHTCAHMAFHHAGDVRLMWLLDAALLASSPELDWDLFLRRALAWRLGYAAQQTLQAALRWPGVSAPPHVLETLTRLGTDSLSRRHWGIGDERPGRAARKLWVSLGSLPWRERIAYLGWLGLRAVTRLPEAAPEREAGSPSAGMTS